MGGMIAQEVVALILERIKSRGPTFLPGGSRF